MKKIENACPICNDELIWVVSNARTFDNYENYISIYKCNTCNKIWKEKIKAYKQSIIERILNKCKNYRSVMIDNTTKIEYERRFKIVEK
jgi:uncharacterized Zn finger protein